MTAPAMAMVTIEATKMPLKTIEGETKPQRAMLAKSIEMLGIRAGLTWYRLARIGSSRWHSRKSRATWLGISAIGGLGQIRKGAAAVIVSATTAHCSQPKGNETGHTATRG